MPKYWHIPGELNVDGKTYTADNPRSSDYRSWYSDSASDYGEHFTVGPTGNGQTDFEKFHVSFEFYSGRNVGIYYQNGNYSPPEKLSNFTESERAVWYDWYSDDENIKWIEDLAQAFWKAATDAATAEEEERARKAAGETS